MDIFQTIINLIDKPDAPKFYRQLQEHYQSKGRIHEAEAIGYLIEKKFRKNNEVEYTTDCQK